MNFGTMGYTNSSALKWCPCQGACLGCKGQCTSCKGCFGRTNLKNVK